MATDVKFYTSYFGNWRKWRKCGVPVSIARSTPKGFAGLSYKKLAPSAELLADWKVGKISEAEYAERYYAEIGKLNKDEVIKELKSLAPGYDIVLLCYEKRGDFCHRHFAGDWLGAEEIR